jgi:hypothetical protein
MRKKDKGTRKTPAGSPAPHPSPLPKDADQAWLTRLWDRFAAADPQGFEQIAASNPTLVEAFGGTDVGMRQLRAALTPPAGANLEARFAESAASVAASPGESGDAAHVFFANPAEIHGLLTSVTRSLSPARALELYRTIAPHVVYETLRTIDAAVRLETVLSVAEHLCSDAVQARLRAEKHVRDALIDELGAAVQDSGIREKLDRVRLQEILEQCGAMRHVVAMSNCIKLARAKAS